MSVTTALECEMSVLGGILLENEALNKPLEFLRPDDFCKDSHRKIFSALIDLSDRGEPSDLVTLTSTLQKQGQLEEVGGSTYLGVLVDYVPTAANINYYCREVKSASRARALKSAATAAAAASEMSVAQLILTEALDSIDIDKKKEISAKFAMLETFRRLESGADPALSTGLPDLDKQLSGGLRAGELFVLAARPGMGKSALALNIATAVARQKNRIYLASYEMSREQIGQRLLATESGVNLKSIRERDHLTDEDWRRMQDAEAIISDLPLLLDPDPGGLLQLRAACRKAAREPEGLGLVIVDYLQIMPTDGKCATREQEIAALSRGLKSLSKELSMPVIALSQLNRSLEHRTDKRPIMADLRESGAIEQDADVIMFIYREAVYCEDCKSRDRTCDKGHEKDAEIAIAKHRQGETGVVRAIFDGAHQRFLPAARRQEACRGRKVVALSERPEDEQW